MRRIGLTFFILFLIGPIGAQEAQRFDEGWNERGSLGFNFSQYVGAMVQLDYNRFGINGATLNSVGFPGGDVNVFSATLDPIVHLTPRGHLDVYLIGGGGLYRRTQEFTEPTIGTFTGFDPFFGFYTATVPSTAIVSSYTVNKPGINGDGSGIFRISLVGGPADWVGCGPARVIYCWHE